MKKILLLFLSISCIAGYSQVQDETFLPQVFSPDAAELGKYGRVPVNYFNGLPNITIPLTELRAKNYTLPVYLSYHASGNKPEQHPGWVGQGWSLHAGGCINRIIRGLKDEVTKDELINTYDVRTPRAVYDDPGAWFTFYLHSSPENGFLVDYPGYLYIAEQFQSRDGGLIYDSLFVNTHNYVDFEPDEFQVNVDGLNASFYITGNGKIKIVSKTDADFTVSYKMNDNADTSLIGDNNLGYRLLDYRCDDKPVYVWDTFSEFVITNKDGTKYYFGGYEDAIEYSMISNMGDDNDWHLEATANTWMLTKIERPDGEVITFSYKRDGIPVVETSNCSIMYLESMLLNFPPFERNTCQGDDKYNFYYLLPSYLESVRCKYGGDYLIFNTGTSTQLDYDYDMNRFCKRGGTAGPSLYNYLMQQNHYEQLNNIDSSHGSVYFDYTNNPNTRLKLNTVNIVVPKGDDLRDTLKYVLTYNSTPLPRYNSFKTDMWGFYNSTTSYFASGLYSSFCERRAVVDTTLLMAEMLTRISYPTGGWTILEYEPHDYSQVVNKFPFSLSSQYGQAGGLRVKKIIDSLPGFQPVEKLFIYKDRNGSSSGILSGFVKYATQGLENFFAARFPTLFGWSKPFDVPFYYECFSDVPLNYLSNTDGSHVTYSMVTELLLGEGRVEYNFSNHDTQEMICMDCVPFLVQGNFFDDILRWPFTSLSLSRGLLLKKTVYDAVGNSVCEEKNTYAQDCSDYIYSFHYFRHPLTPDVYRVSRLKTYTYYPALTRKVVTTYPDGGGVPRVEVSEYEYNDHRQLVREVRRDSVCREEVRTTYSGDISPYLVYAQMQEAGIFDRPVEQTVLRDGAVVSSKLTTYRQSDSLFVPDRMYESRLDTPCPAASWHPYDGWFYDWQRAVYGSPKLSFDSYDSKGNVLAATGEGGACYRYFWEPSGMCPEASFTGMLMPLHPFQADDFAYQDYRLDEQMLTEYSFVFDAERNGPFSFFMDFFDGRGYNFSGTMDGDTVFNYVCPTPEETLPITKIYEGAVTVGHHTFTITYSPEQNSPSLPNGTSWFIPFLSGSAMITYPVYRDEVAADDIDVWFDSFERDGNRSGGYNSRKSWAGQKTITHPITAGIPYTIDWMELRGGQWQYRSEPFSGSRTIGSGATAIDNVRVYPSDAAATNWSWTPTGELRSVTDGRGITESYEYDGMGRLLTVRDGDRKKVASYEYHYATYMQGSPENYVWAKQYTHPAVSDTTSARETVKYYDGLGRPWQTLSVNAGADGVHLCERTDYDASGRPFRTWLPFRTSSLAPQTGVPSEPLYSDAEPYSLIEYAPDPLERPRAEYGPGESWHLNGKAVRHGYLTNGGDPLLRCDSLSIRWTGDTTYVISRAGSRMEGTLAVKSVQDEDGLAVLTFTDLYGRVLLERRHPVSGDDLDTYYVYDDMGRPAAVIPPALSEQKSISSADMDKFAYLYRYDGRGNCTAKKLPGCGWTYMVYDARGALALSQDAEQRRAGRWTLTLTDGQGRPCVTGTCTAAPDVFGSTFGDNSAYARRTGEGGTYYGYTLYMIDPQDFILDQANLWSAYGLTGSYDRVLGPVSGDRLLHTTHAYDAKGREVQTVRETHLGGAETEQFTYSFTDEVLSRTVIHADASGQIMTEQYDYTYDTWGRLLTTGHRVGNGAAVCLHTNVYDGLGRLASDWRNGIASLQTSFQRNVRSWLTGITCGGIFQETLSYESPSFGGAPQWGGRISSADWSFGTDAATRRYVYGYDGHGRLVSAGYYYGVAGGDYDTSYSYDANGNITGMSRTSRVEIPGLLPTKIKRITDYTLSGNQMTGRDTYEMYGRPGSSPRLMSGKGELEPTFPGDEIFLPPTAVAYDRCGRMVRDLDRDILSVEYNRLGLPSRVQYAAADANTDPGAYGVQYAGDGRKLRAGRLVSALIEIEPALSPNAVPMAMAAPGLVERAEVFECPTDYVGNLVYRSGVLDKILVDGGFISAADMAYHFFVADHLGNTRVVANAAGLVEQNYHYYPDGQSIDDGTQIEFDNPYKWSGKEWDGGLGAYDFGARLFAAADSRWTTPDPLAEKYYHISPYAYCAGDPVNLVDPDGLSIWKITRDGRIILVEESDEKFELNNQDGSQSITLEDDTVMNALRTDKEDKEDDNSDDDVSSYCTSKSSSSLDYLMKIFVFVSNSSNVEWGIHFNNKEIAIGTYHKTESGGYWKDFGLSEKPEVSIHSHPEITPEYEISSIGFELNGTGGAQLWHPSDAYNMKHNRKSFAKNALVYFPISHNVIQYESNGYKNRGNYLRKYQRK